VARKSTIPRVVEDRIYEWVQWELGMIETSSIGYPAETMESKLMKGIGSSGGTPSSKCPDVLVPRHLQVIDLVIGRMPTHLQDILITHYSQDPLAPKKQVSKHKLIQAHYWLMGALDSAVMEINTH